jgi:hypothetical protein
MQSFLSTIEEMLEVKLQFNFFEHMQFYQFSMLETTIENGDTLKNELNKLLHTTIQKTESHAFQMQIESFDREHKNRNFSSSEKVFGARLAEMNDDLSFLISSKAEVIRVLQMEQLQQKVEQVINKLQGKFVGGQVENTFQYLRDFYQNEQRIILDSKQYKQFGLLLNGYYGKHSAANQQKQVRRYLNFMEHTIVNIDEKASVEKIDEELQEVQLQITGAMSEPIYNAMFVKTMLERNIGFNPIIDQPKLDKYNGFFVFDMRLGIVKNAEIDIAFSYGENYLKTIHYQLNAVKDATHNN